MFFEITQKVCILCDKTNKHSYVFINLMKENQASFTAMLIAYMRAYHSMHDTHKIFDDFLA